MLYGFSNRELNELSEFARRGFFHECTNWLRSLVAGIIYALNFLLLKAREDFPCYGGEESSSGNFPECSSMDLAYLIIVRNLIYIYSYGGEFRLRLRL